MLLSELRAYTSLLLTTVALPVLREIGLIPAGLLIREQT